MDIVSSPLANKSIKPNDLGQLRLFQQLIDNKGLLTEEEKTLKFIAIIFTGL